jgi:hypothetical protein
VTSAQSEDECGAIGKACEACGTDEVCTKLDVIPEGQTTPVAQAGECQPEGCSDCAPGCCVENPDEAPHCADGTSNDACGSGGGTCSICASGDVCSQQQICQPSASAKFKIVVLGATVPATNAAGSSWDYLSPPDVGITVRVKTTPEKKGTRLDGPDNTTTPTWTNGVAMTATVGEYKQGIAFDVVDRDSPDPDDPIATLSYVPTDAAFASGGAPIQVAEGGTKVLFVFERE